MRAFCALALLANCAVMLAPNSSACLVRTEPSQSPQPALSAADIDVLLLRWSESLELDLQSEILLEAQPLVQPKAALASDARALALVARALCLAGRAVQAQALLENSANARPIEYITLERARMALDDDDLEGALALVWDSAAKTLKTPALPEAYWIAGRARARLGEWEQAAVLLERYLEVEPRSARAASAWHLLAQAALQRKDATRAKFCVEHEEALGRWYSYYNARRIQIRENPREPLPRLGLAQLWLEVEEFSRARAVLDELLVIAPDFARGWMALGETQRKQNDLKSARASYDRALGFDPGLDIARFNRAVIARLEARDDDARADFEVLLAGAAGRDVRFASAHLDLARLLLKSGDQVRAAKAYARYQEFGGKEQL